MIEYKYRVRCRCGAEFEVGSRNGYEAKNDVLRWEADHRAVCPKGAVVGGDTE